MIKRDEETKPGTCWNNALDGERVFVLLARDAAAPTAIRAWCVARIQIGKSKTSDDIQNIAEALDCAARMDDERAEIRRALGKPDVDEQFDKSEGDAMAAVAEACEG